MKLNKTKQIIIGLSFGLMASSGYALNDNHDDGHHKSSGPACEGFGPQTPRDIDGLKGTNPQIFSMAPAATDMNLCNIHFHNNAEHKAADFAIYAGAGDHGHGGGYQCKMSKSLSTAELKKPASEVCKGLKPGDTIEVHWVHSSCQIKPGKGLSSCLSNKCPNPDLRVETQVFTLVNDKSAASFSDYAYHNNMVNGHPQAKSLPSKSGKSIDFIGSTTGPKYTEAACSPMQVTWAVRPKCAKLNINSLGEWCKGNVFKEDHAHGVRKLVTNPKLLSIITK